MTGLMGYFDDPSQEVPAFDPGLGVACPFCAKALGRPMVTVSLMAQDRGDGRSWFYRAHKACYAELPEAEVARYEDSLLAAGLRDKVADHAGVGQAERGITRCWQSQGFHVYMAGPCLDTLAEAIAYRDRLDAAGETWWPQDKPLPERGADRG